MWGYNGSMITQKGQGYVRGEKGKLFVCEQRKGGGGYIEDCEEGGHLAADGSEQPQQYQG